MSCVAVTFHCGEHVMCSSDVFSGTLFSRIMLLWKTVSFVLAACHTLLMSSVVDANIAPDQQHVSDVARWRYWWGTVA